MKTHPAPGTGSLYTGKRVWKSGNKETPSWFFFSLLKLTLEHHRKRDGKGTMWFHKVPDGQLLRKNQALVTFLILLFLIRRSARARSILFCHLSLTNSPAGQISGAYLAPSLSVDYLSSGQPAETKHIQLTFHSCGAPTTPNRPCSCLAMSFLLSCSSLYYAESTGIYQYHVPTNEGLPCKVLI